eukprot:SM000071S21112  [mRNA]  locus=s71:424190:426566:- [translate_table: standard]
MSWRDGIRGSLASLRRLQLLGAGPGPGAAGGTSRLQSALAGQACRLVQHSIRDTANGTNKRAGLTNFLPAAVKLPNRAPPRAFAITAKCFSSQVSQAAAPCKHWAFPSKQTTSWLVHLKRNTSKTAIETSIAQQRTKTAYNVRISRMQMAPRASAPGPKHIQLFSTRTNTNQSWARRIQDQAERVLVTTGLKSEQSVASKAGARSSLQKPAQTAFQKASQSLTGPSGPLTGMSRVASRYKEAAGLQLEAFWRRNYLILVGALGLGVCLLLWRFMYGIANLFIHLSEGIANWGFLALAAAMTSFAALYIRSRYNINPDAVFRTAMRALNTNAGVLEIMGAPLTGSEVRAYVMSGGGLRMKGLNVRLASKRCFVIFPVRGSERRGLVSADVKRKKGKYDFKLLALDVPTAGEKEQRLYLVGNEATYQSSGGVISELRDPIVRALASQDAFEAEDQQEAEEDARQSREQLEIKAEESEAAAERAARVAVDTANVPKS